MLPTVIILMRYKWKYIASDVPYMIGVLCFRYGYITWDWIEGIRSYIYVAFVSLQYALLKLLNLDYVQLVVSFINWFWESNPGTLFFIHTIYLIYFFIPLSSGWTIHFWKFVLEYFPPLNLVSFISDFHPSPDPNPDVCTGRCLPDLLDSSNVFTSSSNLSFHIHSDQCMLVILCYTDTY